MAASLPKYCYNVDASDRLVWVDSQWLAFAAENGARELTVESVLGRFLWDFVNGDEPRRFYEEVHARLRRTNETVVLPFRCDSPALQRHMRLTIAPGQKSELRYESVLVHVKLQFPIAVVDPERDRTNSWLTMCSCCKRSLLEPVGWLDTEEITIRLGLVKARQVPQLCYTICPDCNQTFSGYPHNGSPA